MFLLGFICDRHLYLCDYLIVSISFTQCTYEMVTDDVSTKYCS